MSRLKTWMSEPVTHPRLVLVLVLVTSTLVGGIVGASFVREPSKDPHGILHWLKGGDAGDGHLSKQD